MQSHLQHTEEETRVTRTQERAGTTCKQEATGIQSGSICLDILAKVSENYGPP